MSCAHCQEVDRVFRPWVGKYELKKYRKKGASGATLALIQAIDKQLNGDKATLVDVGGGVGVIHHELLNKSVVSAVHVDASDNYLAIAKEESARRGNLDKVSFYKGDFVDIQDQIPQSSVICLDKVICCYPNINELIQAAAKKSSRLIALSFPKEGFIAKAIVGIGNVFHALRKSHFRNYIHSSQKMLYNFKQNGFACIDKTGSGIWSIWVLKKD